MSQLAMEVGGAIVYLQVHLMAMVMLFPMAQFIIHLMVNITVISDCLQEQDRVQRSKTWELIT